MINWIKKQIALLRIWLWSWRRLRAYQDRKGELREFVYLDEVSVYSLIASRIGPIAAQFTENQTNTLERGFAGTLTANSGIVKSELSPRRMEILSQGSQIVRKSTIQTTFKDFYDSEISSLAFKLPRQDENPPKISNFDDLMEVNKQLKDNKWILDADKLTRGQILEVEVQLEAEPIYQLSVLISEIREILEETQTIGALGSYDLGQLRDIEHIVTKLLVGLVPIRGQLIDYMVLDIDEKKWIVHRKLLDQLPTIEEKHSHPLFIVGVTEQSLFWKDIRRTLFSKARFRIFCRMRENSVQDSWTPIKLTNILETVSPELANQIKILGDFTFANSNNATSLRQTGEQENRMRDALIRYAKLLTEHAQKYLSQEDLSQVEQISNENDHLFSSQKERYEAFEAISRFVHERFAIEREPKKSANFRETALNMAGLDFSGQVDSSMELIIPLTTLNEKQFLDTEVIAIYW